MKATLSRTILASIATGFIAVGAHAGDFAIEGSTYEWLRGTADSQVTKLRAAAPVASAPSDYAIEGSTYAWLRGTADSPVTELRAAASVAFEGTECQSLELADGSTLHVFADGKMAMEDSVGRAFRMAEGEVMRTASGEEFVMQGSEISRVKALHDIHRGG